MRACVRACLYVGVMTVIATFTCTTPTVSLYPSGNVTFCLGDNVSFTCRTTGAPLLWETSSEGGINKVINDAMDMPGNLGIFHLSVLGVREENNVVVEVNSSATTLVGLQPGDDGVTLSCRDATTFHKEMVILTLVGEVLILAYIQFVLYFITKFMYTKAIVIIIYY